VHGHLAVSQLERPLLAFPRSPVVTSPASALLNQTNTTHIAVVGGTGVYEGVTGSVTSVSRGQNSPYTDDTDDQSDLALGA
jgi:hypothetical protein